MAVDMIVVVAIVLSISLGIFLYGRYGGASHTLSDTFALISSVVYIAAGISLMIGGFVWLGAILLLFYTFIGIGKADRLSDRDIRSQING